MSTSRDDGEDRTSTTRLADSMDQMMRLPFEMTGATWDLMMEGVERMTGRRMRRSRTPETTSIESSNERTGRSWFGGDEHDLSGDDLKYVVWSIVFTKPDHECVLEPQREEIVNYSTDGTSFGAMKIAKFLDRARHGHVPKPESWGEKYPNRVERKAEGKEAGEGDRGWRIPADDHKYIKFLYRVDHRMAKQEDEVERVTIERGSETKTVKIV